MSSTRAEEAAEQWARGLYALRSEPTLQFAYQLGYEQAERDLSQREIEVRAEERERAVMWGELVKLLKLLAHPKFTTDDQGHIHYYITRADVEAARILQNRIEQVGDSENRACLFCNEQGFDLIGLKSHLQKGDCEEFENLERLRRP
jgi:hypothetical protein